MVSTSSVADPAIVPASHTVRRRVDPRLIASLAAVYVIWSSTYLAIRIAVTELPPLLSGSLRFCAGGLVLFVVARYRGARWPSLRTWLQITPIGVLLFVAGNGFVAIAETTVSSSGAAVVCATMPLWVGVLGVVAGERPSRREWLSLVVGFIGVVVLMGGPSLVGDPTHIVLVIASPVCWALGSVLARRLSRQPDSESLMLPAVQMITGGIGLAIAGLVLGEQFPTDAGLSSWLALGYLWLFGSVIAFTAYAWLLRNSRPAVATSYAYVNPILAVIIGAVLSGEPLGVTTVVANVLIVGAIALVLVRPR